mgnify:CR=1 FL=1
MFRRLWMVPPMTALLLAAADPKAHQAEVDTWHQARLARLQSDSGWLTVVGLSWLQEGANPAGSGEGATVKFPATAPRTLGTFTRTGERITFSADPGVTITADGKAVKTVEMLADDTGKPTTLSSGTFTWLVIRRGARLGVRIRDSNAPARTGFKGVERFAVDGQWQVSARFEPSATPRKLKIATVIGTTEELVMPGTLVFTLDGKEHRLEPVIEDGSCLLYTSPSPRD